MCVCVDCRSQKTSDPLELEVQVFVSCQMWVLGTKLRLRKKAIIPKLSILKPVSVSEGVSSRNMGL